MDIKRNITLLMDFYELTMSNGYFINNLKDDIAVFDLFYRKNPDDAAYSIFVGLEFIILGIIMIIVFRINAFLRRFLLFSSRTFALGTPRAIKIMVADKYIK